MQHVHHSRCESTGPQTGDNSCQLSHLAGQSTMFAVIMLAAVSAMRLDICPSMTALATLKHLLLAYMGLGLQEYIF